MAIGDRDSDETLLVPFSESLVRKLDAARGDESYSEYVDRVLKRAAKQTETELAEVGTVVGESRRTTNGDPTATNTEPGEATSGDEFERLVASPGVGTVVGESRRTTDSDPTATSTEPGEATSGDEFEQLWNQQIQTVFVWLWVVVVATYGVGDLISTYFVVRAGIGFEANPLIAGLLEIHPALMLLWKAVALVTMYAIAESMLRNADTRIPWGSLVVPGVLVVWGSFVTGMNVMNIPQDAQSVASASILSSIVTIVLGYVLVDLVYQNFVEGQGEYDGILTTARQWIFDRPWVRRLQADSRASRAVRGLGFPGVLVGVATIVGVLVVILPPGGEFRSFLSRPTRSADLLLASTGLVTGGLATVLLSRQVDAPWAVPIRRTVMWLLRIGMAVTAVVSALFLLSLTSTGGIGLLLSIEAVLESVVAWFTVRIGPLARPGMFYMEHSPIGLSVGEVAAVMAVAGLLSSLPMLVVIYRNERTTRSLVGE